MRWSLRRGKQDADAPAEQAPAAPGSSAPAISDPGWRAVAPMAGSWSTSAPLTSSGDPSTVRPLEPRRGTAYVPHDADGTGDPVAPEPGRVAGLAVARAVVTPTVPVVEPAPYALVQPPLRHAPTRPLVERSSLTRATEEYVGEPVAPAPPVAPRPPAASESPIFGSPAPRRADPVVEAATDAGARFQEALANLHRSGLPRYVSPSEGGPPPAPEPPRPPAAPTPPPEVQPPLTHLRRNTLAQSRRLGLGAPIRREDIPSGEHGAEARDAGDSGGDAGDAEPAPVVLPAPPSDFPQPAPASGYDDASLIHPPMEWVRPEPAALESGQHDAPDDEPGGGGGAPIEPIVVPAHPIIDSSVHPTASTTPLVFRSRATGPDLDAAADRAIQRAVVTRPPAELAQALRSSHGIDVGDVPVHRDLDAGIEARERRARAFARSGRVYLPEDLGPTHSSTARGVLAHELVHVAQQRRLGTALPSEDTDHGRALEEEARAAERMYSSSTSEGFGAPELVHSAPPVSASFVHNAITQRAATDPPVDYLDPSQSSSIGTQGVEIFRQEAQTAVQQVVRELSLTPNTAFTDQTQAGQAEQRFLDIINAQLRQRDQAPQSQLSEQDRRKIADMFAGGQGAGGSGNATGAMDTAFGQQLNRTFGSASALGGDVGGLVGGIMGLIEHRRHPSAQPGQSGQSGQSGGTGGSAERAGRVPEPEQPVAAGRVVRRGRRPAVSAAAPEAGRVNSSATPGTTPTSASGRNSTWVRRWRSAPTSPAWPRSSPRTGGYSATRTATTPAPSSRGTSGTRRSSSNASGTLSRPTPSNSSNNNRPAAPTRPATTRARTPIAVRRSNRQPPIRVTPRPT